jgi:tetratricopeptide (TPR) repeat protein
VLEVKNRPGDEILGGLWDFAHGYAQLKTGNADFAKVYLDRVKKAADTSKATFRDHTAKHLLGTVAGILEGEILLSSADTTAAIAAFERGVTLEDQLGYDEPEPLPFAARHWLGAALLDAKRFADAERVYREELEDHPHNGWSLLGLQKALAGQGKRLREVDEDLSKSWSRSDTWLRSSKF